jgi:hypothetical protein
MRPTAVKTGNAERRRVKGRLAQATARVKRVLRDEMSREVHEDAFQMYPYHSVAVGVSTR